MPEQSILQADYNLLPQIDPDIAAQAGSQSRHVSASLFRRGRVFFSASSEQDQRRTREAFAADAGLSRENPGRVWQALMEISPDPDWMSGNNLFPSSSDHPAVTQFDMLRTRLLQGLAAHGWSRIGITSATHSCGKSFVALNLAFSLARRPQSRTVLVDLDLRRPRLAELLGGGLMPVGSPGGRSLGGGSLRGGEIGPLADFLGGSAPIQAQFRRYGLNLALGLNNEPVSGASELLQNSTAVAALETIQQALAPEVTLYDLPPALLCDDVIALAGQLDAILLVADGTKSSPDDLRACQRLFEGRLPLMGVVLNRTQDRQLSRYRYGKR